MLNICCRRSSEKGSLSFGLSNFRRPETFNNKEKPCLPPKQSN
ncbi:hypothetical protein NEISICOT_02200 [Neisseria sicca ATCC 29256]|uniref:Uncharacterized protein n=1 Tax=Neisseria sicca ATCC 29256 TaxID=547045 RepID=C6M6P8_NEISI|nr:hypothetical protein NEISICOT_02200 [Neisseria sicca ATCC 29256]